jgi:molybdopterin-binding protein
MKQSTRNQLPGRIKEIISDKVLSEVVMETEIGEVASVITTPVRAGNEFAGRRQSLCPD